MSKVKITLEFTDSDVYPTNVMARDSLMSCAKKGTRIWFAEEKLPYTVKARTNRYLVCTKPFAAMHTCLYTVVDLKESIRGTENLIFPMGAETEKQCIDMAERLGVSSGVSHRNRIPLHIRKIVA